MSLRDSRDMQESATCENGYLPISLFSPVTPVSRSGGAQRSAFSIHASAILAIVLAAALVGCGDSTKVTRVDSEVVTDLSGRWNDTDSRQVAETMVKEALNTSWLEDYTRSHSKPPVVVVGTIRNRSHEHINTQTFITDLERALVSSQKVAFVAGRAEREEIRQERQEQASHAREDTQKAPGKEIGADYMLKGNISTILDEADGVKAIFYQVDLEMVDLESNVKAWYGQKKIKKVVERKRTLF